MTKKSFHLRWNNHLQNLQSLFENLYNEQTLIDVTLSCSDGLLYGHKLVLSACSPYFEQVFKNNPCNHPIMILKGISRRDMQVLLEYMYIGSVDVGEEDLEMLLDIATELQIKGLVQSHEESPIPLFQSTKLEKAQHYSKDSQNTVMASSSIPHNIEDLRWQAELVAKPSGSKLKESDSLSKQRQTQENQMEFEPFYLNHEMKEETLKEEYQETSEEESGKDYVNPSEESSSSTPINYNPQENKTCVGDEVNYFCHMCTRGFQNKGSYHRHMMTHAGVKPHHCTFCEQSFLRQSHLQRHIRVHTGERPYSCGQCPKQFARSDKLRQHYIIQHNAANSSKTSKPRGRPRKNPVLCMPSTSSASTSALNSSSPVIVTLNAM